MDADQINRTIGKRIRELRNMNGLTQQELADRTELTKGYISQLENGLVAPSMVTLLDLIECLGTTPSRFFDEDRPDQVVFSEEDFFEKIDEGGSSIQWIVPMAQKYRMEPLLVVIQPGRRILVQEAHEGEEFGFVLSGSVQLHLDEKQFTVRSGESFYFAADRGHYIENVTEEPARLIWVSSPPTF